MKLPIYYQISKAQQKTVWSFGNDILYDLCKNNFEHNQDDKILTKVLFIDTIAPALRNSQLDKYLGELKTIKYLNVDSIKLILQTHSHLTSTLYKITNLEKRSFSSKYLHFHLPDLFFIYDSRAVTAMRLFTSQVPNDLGYLLKLKNIDAEYAKFFCKCFELKQQIKRTYNLDLTNRELDNLLIHNTNNKNL